MQSANSKAEGPSIEALLYQAQKDGVLPITSECGAGCLFCSNHYNPPGCEVYSIGRRSLEDIKESIPWLQAAPGPVVIGESVTRINEGEPLMHPDLPEILEMVRAAYPHRTVRLTTNGMLLTPALIDLISDLRVELTVSLNTVSKREQVMGDRDPQATLANVAALGGKVRFDGSMVALPFVTGWEDLVSTARFLKESGAETVRMLLPGFSSRHPLFKEMLADTWPRVKELAKELAADLRLPVLAEPPGLRDTRPEVEFVQKGSPADRAGVLPGDLVTKVAGRTMFSRKDAFMAVKSRENPQVTLDRQGAEIGVVLKKNRYESPGFVMYEDMDREAYMNWERSSQWRRGRDVLVLTSALARPILEDIFRERGVRAKVAPVKSRFFGGNIQAAGLLTVRDFWAAYERVVTGGYSPVEVTLPRIAFDAWGRDLEGVHYREFAERSGLPVILAG
ncbi:MAG: DUF512 domain-containing protein [Bacillota bacterium]